MEWHTARLATPVNDLRLIKPALTARVTHCALRFGSPARVGVDKILVPAAAEFARDSDAMAGAVQFELRAAAPIGARLPLHAGVCRG